MAAGTMLVLEFADAGGNSLFFSFPYGNSEATSLSVKNAMNSFIDNGSIFIKPPVSIRSAKAVTTTESKFDLSD